MKKYYLNLPLAIAVIITMLSPASVLAHGHTSFEINETVYSFTVGSLNEPIAVDDKTGLDLRVMSMSHHAHEVANMTGVEHAGTPAVGLEKTLKVELIAGDKKKVLDIAPAYNDPGAYKAYFIPTVQTTFSYRIFGTIDKVPFDYTFTCNPAGHPVSPEDKTEVEVSEGVTRIEAAGAFSCPLAKADLGFPEQSTSIYDLKTGVSEAKTDAASSGTRGTIGIVVGFLGLIAGGGALAMVMKRRVV